MMRSLYSGVSGLRVHQTKMDIIGNNIANVNTVGFKASSANFADFLYQTTQSASGANPNTGAAGQNAIQVGLGANLASVTTNITTPGGSQRTDVWSDLMINGDNFFIINQGGSNYFTKAGAFYVDGAGNLAMKSGGGKVMGWKPDPANPNEAKKDVVSELEVMSPENMISSPSKTENLNISGNLDPKDSALGTDGTGIPIQFEFYDSLGNPYKTQVIISNHGTSTDAGVTYDSYQANITDITDSNGKSIFTEWDAAATPAQYKLKAASAAGVTFGGVKYTATLDPNDGLTTGKVILTPATAGTTPRVFYDAKNGKYAGVSGGTGIANGDAAAKPDTTVKEFGLKVGTGIIAGDPIHGSGVDADPAKPAAIGFDFSKSTQLASTSKKSTLTGNRGAVGTRAGAGYGLGQLKDLSILSDGKIYATYDNGDQKLLGQIAVTSFANPSGLQAMGNSLFAATQNSGDFDGIGKDPTQGGDSLSAAMLEMSNVDLSGQFTDMITTQRGFQANSRIITTSDTLLEELINLKR